MSWRIYYVSRTPKMSGGMSYRTMDDIDNSLILKYLEGCDFHSKTTILNKNKTYYIASADKTIARLKFEHKQG